MIKLLTTMRRQTACYWPPAKDSQGRVVPSEDGGLAFGLVRELRVFWMDTAGLSADAAGTEAQSAARVFVGEDVDRLGALWFGKMADIPDGLEDKPLSIKDAALVQKFVKTPTLTPGEFVRVAYL